MRLATLTQQSGLGGVVCSAEAAQIKALCVLLTTKVTPGIRPSFAAANDQQRIMTPSDALNADNALVIGRPVTQAAEPMMALATAEAELAG